MTKRPDAIQGETVETEPADDPTRRTFLKMLMGASAVMSTLTFAPLANFFIPPPVKENKDRKKIGNTKDLPEGSTMIFFYPGDESDHRSFLTHLSAEYLEEAEEEGTGQFITDGFVAFNSVCPHLLCPIELPHDDVFICPCHGGFFSIIDGTVLGGPAPRPLPAIRLEIDKASGDIYAAEIIGKIGYGRD
jgi:arsenite oxidase small subunit